MREDFASPDEETASAGSDPTRTIARALTFSVLLHLIVLAPLLHRLPASPAGPERLSRPMQLSLSRPPSEKAATDTQDRRAEPSQADESNEPMDSARPTRDPPRAPEDSAGSETPSPIRKLRRLDFDRLTRQAVESMERNNRDFRLGNGDEELGSSVFDPAMREALRQSQDINTPAPAKAERVRSYSNPDGSLYVEVGDGSCFEVEEARQAGEPGQWNMIRCRGGKELELDPKPYAQID